MSGQSVSFTSNIMGLFQFNKLHLYCRIDQFICPLLMRHFDQISWVCVLSSSVLYCYSLLFTIYVQCVCPNETDRDSVLSHWYFEFTVRTLPLKVSFHAHCILCESETCNIKQSLICVWVALLLTSLSFCPFSFLYPSLYVAAFQTTTVEYRE